MEFDVSLAQLWVSQKKAVLLCILYISLEEPFFEPVLFMSQRKAPPHISQNFFYMTIQEKADGTW